MNYFNFHDVKRSLLRNLVFNTLRCMPEEVIYNLLYGTVDPPEVIYFRIASIWVLTILT